MMMIKKALIIYWIIFFLFLIPFILGKNVIAMAENFHDLIDAISVTFSFYVTSLTNRYTSTFTYGLHRLEVISALINVVVIIFGAIFSLYLSLTMPSDNFSILTLSFSVIAIILLLTVSTHEEKDENINEKSVILHSIFDILAYIVGILTIIISYFIFPKFVILGGAITIVILSVILSLKSAKQSLLILLEGSPIDVEKLEKELKEINSGIHHVHVWAICGHIKIATLHVEVNENMTIREIDLEREKIEKILKEKYGITHTTIQFESKKVD